MSDLFKKLNTLVQANLNQLLARRGRLQPAELGKDVDQEVKTLRQRINDAFDYEDKLGARVQQLSQEVARWDEQADAAVLREDDAAARHAIDMMQRAQQRLAMAESDLNEHRLVTEELVRRVNELEAVIAEARRSEPEDQTAAPEGTLSDLLRDAREKITGIAQPSALEEEEEDERDDRAIDDDLSQRRRRLSKPGS